jgi:hypothetical protein
MERSDILDRISHCEVPSATINLLYSKVDGNVVALERESSSFRDLALDAR